MIVEWKGGRKDGLIMRRSRLWREEGEGWVEKPPVGVVKGRVWKAETMLYLINYFLMNGGSVPEVPLVAPACFADIGMISRSNISAWNFCIQIYADF